MSWSYPIMQPQAMGPMGAFPGAFPGGFPGLGNPMMYPGGMPTMPASNAPLQCYYIAEEAQTGRSTLGLPLLAPQYLIASEFLPPVVDLLYCWDLESDGRVETRFQRHVRPRFPISTQHNWLAVAGFPCLLTKSFTITCSSSLSLFMTKCISNYNHFLEPSGIPLVP